MNTMKKITLAVAGVAMAVGLVACGGGGGSGSTSTGGDYYSHDELAREFVRRVNSDLSGIDLSLVKDYTLQTDYIVAYDSYYDSYDAYYLGEYNVGESMANYFNQYEDYFYYDLIPESGNYYYDPYSGTRFEKQEMSSKNLAKVQALKEQLMVNKMAEKLSADYGLSAEKSVDVARFAYKVQNAPAGSYKAADYDAFVKELSGSTITEFQADAKAGNNESLSRRIDIAAEKTGLGTEGVNKLIGDMFGNE